MNLAAWHGVFKWLRQGGVFAIFPAGRVSRFSFRHWRITDAAWNPHLAAVVRRTGARVLPVYFPGANGMFFQLASLLYNTPQNPLLVREFNKMAGRRLKVIVGEQIPPGTLAGMNSDQKLMEYLRERTYALAAGLESTQYVQLTGLGKSTIS